ncbi:EAL domain-containing protein [Motiliproteus sp.]|uniref:bifunctional diguanylate cyclase/phosphodiesterase n=1 Tax=Motiliproteus sp. TaxID=1898955 RepID=UPI003BAB81A7
MQRRFFSLKWKLLLLMTGVLFALGLAVSGISYLHEENLLESERQKQHRENVAELERQIRAVQQQLIKRLEYLTLLIQPDDKALTITQLQQKLERHYSFVEVLWGLESLQANSSSQGVLLSRGSDNPVLRDQNLQAIQDEQPMVGLSCDEGCRALASVPLMLSGAETGSLGVATSLAEVVLQSQQRTGWDTGVLIKNEVVEPATLPNWQLNIVAMSNISRVLPQLRALTQQQSFNGPGSYLLQQDGRSIEVSLTPLQGLDDRQQAYWVLIADVSSGYADIQKTFIIQLGITLGALFASGFLIVSLLNAPMRKLGQVATTLPSLALRDFDHVRNQFENQKDFGKESDDELSLLIRSTVQLADELERLDREMRMRNLKLERSSQQLSRQKDFASGLLDNAQAVILVQDTQGRCKSLNRFGRQLLGHSEWQSQTRDFNELFGELSKDSVSQMEELYTGMRHHFRHETRCFDVYGNLRTLSWIHSSLTQNDRSHSILSIGMDVTEQVKIQRQLRWLANHDSLTKLPNRSSLQQQLHRRIEQARDRQSQLAVMFCDLDNFKQINDTLGHPVGDSLLIQVAERLKQVVRHQDTVARIGGDEFVILIDDNSHGEAVLKTADQMLECLEATYNIQGQELYISASIGIAFYPEHGGDATTLIKHADIAMYQSKSDGRKQYSVYSHDQSQGMEERLNLTADLRHGLQRNEFELFYQPQMSIDESQIVGVEALIRWHHPEQGMVPPDKFIGIAEETGLIIDMGRWIIREACQQLQRWSREGMDGIRMSINLAGPQIMSDSLLEDIRQVLEETEIEPTLLEFEITESFIMSQPENTIARLNEIKLLGIKLSIDDFGTGYSSLGYLKRLPIDKLKIDKSFVFDIGRCSDDEAIAVAVIGLGQSLNLQVIAEGVEEAQHVEFLRAHGCDELQGFYYSKPLPAENCAEFIRQYRAEKQTPN